jgi:two-component system, cell cycle sensor histidine kinase and response regulator CckA
MHDDTEGRRRDTAAATGAGPGEAAFPLGSPAATGPVPLDAQALQAQKRESLGVLAAGVAHHFNNLLTGILGYADLAQRVLPADSPVRPMLAEIEGAAKQAAELARLMLSYSGRGKPAVQSQRLDAIVRDMVPLLRAGISPQAHLAIEGEPVRVECDASQMRQLVMNPVTHASEALHEQPCAIRISVGVRVVQPGEHGPHYVTGTLVPGVYALLAVHDTGCGMDEHTKARIFDPFFSTKAEGRGLGLPAVLGIVRGHGGVIEATSGEGKGSVFAVLLPRAERVDEEGPLARPPG